MQNHKALTRPHTHTQRTQNRMAVNNSHKYANTNRKTSDVCACAFKYSVYIFNKIKRKYETLKKFLFIVRFVYSFAKNGKKVLCMNTLYEIENVIDTKEN